MATSYSSGTLPTNVTGVASPDQLAATNAAIKANNYGPASNYSYSPNGSGGLNYYGSPTGIKTPITNAQYGAATGQDYATLEAQALAAYKNQSGVADTGMVDGASTTAAAQNAAANDQAVNAGLSRLDTQRQTGLANILGGYNTAYQTLIGNKGTALANLDLQRQQATLGNQTARDNIGQSVRMQNQGLQRLLGAHGAGNSSASSILAPYAAAQQGNIQRSQVNQAYGNNMGQLDNAVTSTNTGYDNSFGSLLNDKQTQEQQLNNDLETNRASLLGQRSDAVNNQPAIQAILDSVARLGVTPQFTPKAVQVAAPNLSAYNYDGTSAPIQSNGVDPNIASGAGPYLSLLTNQKDKMNQPALAGV